MTDDSLLAKLAEEFTAEVRAGKPADIEAYARNYPKLAERIRELFPTLMMLEGVADGNDPESAKPPMQAGLSPDSVFGQYRIKREIGRGGMGIVYEAVHLLLEKRVALKVLPVRTEMDAAHLERFFREARTAAGLHHTNIVPVFDVGQVAGTPYYAMEYIEGRGLDAILRIMQPAISDATSDVSPPDSEQETASEVQISSGQEIQSDEREKKPVRGSIGSSVRIRAGLPARSEEYFRWVARMGIQAAEGLAHAHERKVIHRDIKPSNLLLDKQGVLWITDFGLARRIEDPAVTQSGVLLGTPRYMSPEQAQAAKRPMDQRSDIYSLGATLYELLTCRPVFDGKTPHDVISQILTREPVAPRRLNAEIPADLATIVMKAMAKRPEDRYQSADQLAEDLNRWLRMEPIKARRVGPVGRTIRWCRRNPRLAAVTATAAVLILTLSGIYYASLMKENTETRLALQRETEARNLTLVALNEAEVSKQQADTARERAEEAQMLAQESQKLAESEKDEAQAQRQAADLQHREALYQSYRSNLLAADLSYQVGEIDAAKERLALCDASLRGWEWHYLHRSVDMSLASHSLGILDPMNSILIRSVMEVTFADDSQSIFIRAHQMPSDGPDFPKVSVFRYHPNAPDSFTNLVSGTSVIATSPNGSHTLSSDWNLFNVNVRCVVEGDNKSSHAVCQPVSYRSTPSSNPKALAPEDRNRLIVTDTMSGRVIATLHHPNLAVWTGDVKTLISLNEIASLDIDFSDAASLKEKEINGGSFSMAISFYRWHKTGFSKHFANAVGAEFSPDGEHLATWSWDNIIYIWDLRTQSLLASLQGHRDAVRSVSFSPDMMHIASSSADDTVRLWQIGSEKKVEEFQVPDADALAYSPDGSRIAVGTDSGSVLMFGIGAENSPSRLSGHKGPISSMAFSPDSLRLATASYEDRRIHLWDIASGILLKTFVGHTDGVLSLAFSPDGLRIASGSASRTVRVWNARSTLAILKGHGNRIAHVGLTSGGISALASHGRTLRIWNTVQLNAVRALEFDDEHGSAIPGIETIAIDKDRIRVVVSHSHAGLPSEVTRTVYRVVDIESGNQVFAADSMSNLLVRGVGLTPDAARMAVLSRNGKDGAVHLYETKSGKLLATWTFDVGITSRGPIALSSDGSLIAVGVNKGSGMKQEQMKTDILIFSADSPRVLLSIPIMMNIAGPLTFLPDRKRIAFAKGSRVHVWDLHTHKEVGILTGHDKAINALFPVGAITSTPDGKRIVTGGGDGTVRIWDADRYDLLLTLRIPSDDNGDLPGLWAKEVSVLAVSSDGKSIAAGTEGGKVYVWHSDPAGERR